MFEIGNYESRSKRHNRERDQRGSHNDGRCKDEDRVVGERWNPVFL